MVLKHKVLSIAIIAEQDMTSPAPQPTQLMLLALALGNLRDSWMQISMALQDHIAETPPARGTKSCCKWSKHLHAFSKAHGPTLSRHLNQITINLIAAYARSTEACGTNTHKFQKATTKENAR
jgi:hypothetical protein